jgi:hypothetical protein
MFGDIAEATRTGQYKNDFRGRGAVQREPGTAGGADLDAIEMTDVPDAAGGGSRSAAAAKAARAAAASRTGDPDIDILLSEGEDEASAPPRRAGNAGRWSIMGRGKRRGKAAQAQAEAQAPPRISVVEQDIKDGQHAL